MSIFGNSSFGNGVGYAQAAVSMWDTFNKARYNRELLKEQKKERKNAEEELKRRNARIDEMQSYFNKIW